MRFLQVFAVVAALAFSASAGAEEPRVYLFWGASCPHSQAARAFLLKQRERDPDMQLIELETEGNLGHAVLLARLFEKIGLPELTAVPTIVIGANITIGYIDDVTTGQELMETLAACRKNTCSATIERLIEELGQPDQVRFIGKSAVTCRAAAEKRTLR